MMKAFIAPATLVAALALPGIVLDAQESAPARPAGAYMNVGFVALTNAGWSTAPNLAAILQGDHDPKVRGFTIPNTELTLDGAVDPYFKGFGNIVFKLDENGETGVELEEAFVITTAMPANLQVKLGQFFTEFGRQNPLHPHSWAFVDQPVILSRLFGPEGLRSQGVRLSWLVPTPWYSEAMVTVANSTNGTTFSFRSEESSEIHGGVPVERAVLEAGDMLVVPRVATSFDLTSGQTLLLGASGAFGPNNSGPAARTMIYGIDGFWKWKSATAQQGFPFMSLQAEALLRRYEAAARTDVGDSTVTLPAGTFGDRGGYAQLLWGIRPRIVAGVRADVANGDVTAFASDFRGDRLRVSPNLTWYPTEFSKLRFQYNYDNRKTIRRDHSFWVQFEFLLGAHAAHKF
ncbi:MAG: hypothetical protein AABZ80_07265 [Gemmatimonadota bacterium]